MVFKFMRNFTLAGLAFLVCVGFKIYPSILGWQLDSSSAGGRKVFITLSTSGKSITNDLPADDALSASGSVLTETQLLNSIITDYNSVQGSNLILALDSDTDFSSYSTNHRITIEEGAAAGLSSGEARVEFSNRSIIGCKILLTEKAYESAQSYIALLTHELGHCMGLDHPQETVWAVMSYFYTSEVYRLAIDDKMGLVHLYGNDPTYRNEIATGGLSCSMKH